MTMLQPQSDHWFYRDDMTTQEVNAVRLHIIARKSKIDALAEVYDEYRDVMNDEEMGVKYKRSKLTGKASAFFRRPKIRKYIAECREELAKDLNITKAEWTEQVIVDADVARDDNMHMAVAKNMELIGKACGFMDTSVTVKHEHVTKGQFQAQMNEELKILALEDPENYKLLTQQITGDDNVKVIESTSYKSDSEPMNVSSPIDNNLDT